MFFDAFLLHVPSFQAGSNCTASGDTVQSSRLSTCVRSGLVSGHDHFEQGENELKAKPKAFTTHLGATRVVVCTGNLELRKQNKKRIGHFLTLKLHCDQQSSLSLFSCVLWFFRLYLMHGRMFLTSRGNNAGDLTTLLKSGALWYLRS